MYLNEAKLIGNLGGDAATVELNGGSKKKVSFQVATQRSWLDKGTGEYQTRNDWHRVVVWGPLTKFAAGLKKGERVLVTGEIRSREYDKQVVAGKKTQDVTMYITEIYATSVRRMDRRKPEDTTYETSEQPEEEAPLDDRVPY